MTLTETTITRTSSDEDFNKYGTSSKSNTKKFIPAWRTSESEENLAGDGLAINKSVGVEVTYSDVQREKTSAREVV